MQIRLSSVLVDDQEKALRFYTTVLGSVRLVDGEFAGRRARCGTGSGVDEFSSGADLSKVLFDASIPATAVLTEDIQAEFARLKERGVIFQGEPKSMGAIISVVFEDSCGNLINLVQPLL